MVDAYDSYRLSPQVQADPWALGSGPQQFYGDSSSLWGNFLDRTREGAKAGKGAGAMAVAQNYVPWTRIPVVGSAINAFKGQGIEGLGDANNWRNFVSFGARAGKASQEEARNNRKRAVAEWQGQQRMRLGDLLGQQGADVRQDLGGELEAAIGAGGDMGDMDATQNAMTQFQQRLQQYMLGRQRAGQARQVDAMFADPRRAAERGQRLGAERTRSLADLAEQYRVSQRGNSFNQARRGMQGSSVDVEKQGEMARQRDLGAGAIQAGLDEKSRAYRLGDEQQRNTLKGLIYADDPNMAAAFGRSLDSINEQGRLVQEQAVARQQGQALQNATATSQSQAVGGLLTGVSKPLGYYVEHQGGGA